MKLLIQILFAGLVVSCALQAGVEQSASEALPDPAVSLWIMGGKGDEIVQGWPAIVTVDSLPANVGAVKLATARVRGPDLSWPWQQVSTASSGESHSRTWVLSAGDTASLPLGDAIVRISSDPLPVPVNSVLRVHVLAAPEALSPDQQADRAQGEIEYARITGDVAGSLGAAERWVLAAPGNPDALLAKARVLLALKRPEEALQAADRALAMVDKLGGKAEPPFTILRVRQEAMDAYLTVHPPPRADPASADTTQYYRFLFQGDMAEGQGDHGAARASYLQAQQWLAEKKLPLDPTEVARRLEKVEAVPAGQASRHTASNSQLVPEVASSGSKRPLAANPPANPDDAIFAQDPHGQWASTAEASSAYGSDRYSARQSTGAPNVMHYGDFAEAWASKTPDGQQEWLKLTFAKPVRATAVRVRQNYNPGAVSKIEAFAADGRSLIVWSGRDTSVYAKGQIAWFTATFEPPPFPVQAIKLTLDSVKVKGWNEIDAVQLIGEE